MDLLPSVTTFIQDPRPKPTEQEQKTRQEAGFAEMEYSLPTLSYRMPSYRLFEALTSYLGSRNPFSQAFDPVKDELWLFDNTAYPTDAGAATVWKAEYVAAFFRKGSGKDIGKVVADVAEKLAIAKGSDEEATIASRMQPFIDSILPARTVEVALEMDDGDATASELRLKLGPSGRSGIISDEREIPSSLIRTLEAPLRDGTAVTIRTQAVEQPKIASQTKFANRTGWTIVSDVDDTIKVTLTSAPLGILRTTFVDEPRPISGMPELYSHMNEVLNGPTWFYLSASPYNLYPFLRDFRSTYYPAGTIILRDASWMTLGGLLTSMTVGTQAYKVSRLKKIHRWLPDRKTICIGDSTQTDPETYGEMYRNHPGNLHHGRHHDHDSNKGPKNGGSWIQRIFIRKVLNVAELDHTNKNSDRRFENAFRDVPRHVWRTFEDPKELYAAVQELVATNTTTTTTAT